MPSQFIKGQIVDTANRPLVHDLQLNVQKILEGDSTDRVLVYMADGTVRFVQQSAISSTPLPLISVGDLLVMAAAGLARLAVGTDGQVLTADSTADEGVEWATPAPAYTNEDAQDAVGGSLTDSASVDFTYDDAANTITAVVLPAGVDHGGLGGLGDDDHTQYVLRSILTTNGDLFVRLAGAVSRLAVGSENQILRVTSSLPAWGGENELLGIYGSGTDGAADFDGTNTFSFASKSGSVYTISRDVFLTNMTVRNGSTVKTANFRIFGTGTLTVESGGILHNNGNAGSVGGQPAGGSAGTAVTAQSLAGSTAGGNGGAGNSSGVGTTGGVGTVVTGDGGASGTSGAGGAGATSGGGAGRAATALTRRKLQTLTIHILFGTALVGGGSSGAGGGGGGGDLAVITSEAGGGGGGGAGASWMGLWFRTISNSGTISCNGGAGGNGGAAIDGADGAGIGGGGGGAGGGGGVVYMVFDTYSGSAAVASGGAAGTGGGKIGTGVAGSNGGAGSAGTVISISRLTGITTVT